MPKTFWLILYFILLLSLEFVFWGRLIAYFQDIFTQLISILDCILGGIYGERFLNAEFPLDSPWPRSLRRRYYIGVYFLPSGFCKYYRSCTEYFPEILSKISTYLPLDIKTIETRLHEAEKPLYFVRIVALVQGFSRKFCLKS